MWHAINVCVGGFIHYHSLTLPQNYAKYKLVPEMFCINLQKPIQS